MKALVFRGPNHLVVEDHPKPSPGPGEAVVAVRAAGICGSDLHGYTGSGRRIPGVVMGHEIAGVVDRVGVGVDKTLAGREVVVFPMVSCGSCKHCLADAPQLCNQRSYLGVHSDGAFAEYVLVEADNLYFLQDEVSFASASLAEPLAVAIHAVSRAPAFEGASVLIAGAGPIGILIAVVAQRQGATAVVVTDPEPARRRVALDIGADHALDPKGDGFDSELDAVYPDGAGIAFDAVGLQATFDQCLRHTCASGTIVAVGGWKVIDVDLARVVAKELAIIGTFNFTRFEFEAAVGLLADVEMSRLVNTRVGVDDAPELFARLARERGEVLKAVLTP